MIETCQRGHPRNEKNTYVWKGGKNCRACAVENRAARKAQGGGSVKHGAGKYASGCRCEVCREGHRLSEMRNGRARRTLVASEGLPPHIRHGVNAYRNWGCRCEVCREDASTDTRLRREAKDAVNGIVRRATRTGNGYLDEKGYRRVRQPEHPNVRKNGWMFEHVKVMTEILGRPLVKGENVHHINGVRDDNRPENLELWVTSQPSGQRPEDLVAWAREILARYET